MKAYHYMMGMFLFNMSIAVFNNLGIWNIGYGLTEVETMIAIVLIGVAITAITLAIAVAIPFIGQGLQSGAVYAAFSGIYIAVWGYTATLLYSLTEHQGILIFLAVFSAIVMLILAAGLYQMATGGWQNYE